MMEPRSSEAVESSATSSDTFRPPTRQSEDVAPDELDSPPSPLTQMHRSDSRYSRTSRNERRASRPSTEYDIPESYRNLDDVYGPAPVQNPDEEAIRRVSTLEDDHEERRHSLARRRSSHGASDVGSLSLGRQRSRRMSAASAAAREARMLRRRSTAVRVDYDVPDHFSNLNEVSAISPIQNPDEDFFYKHENLEEARSQEQEFRRRESVARRRQSVANGSIPELPDAEDESQQSIQVSRLATQLYTISYLVLFSIFGTLARLGLQALTSYSGAPVSFSSVWPNFGGSLIMGFLAEDRMLFRFEWGTPTYEMEIQRARESGTDEENGSGSERNAADLAAAKKAYMATKKTIPLYIGLATGFCGSFTSFSSFVRDVFLALSNDMPVPGASGPTLERNGGYSFLALISVVLTTVALSLSGLFIGAHLAIALEPFTPSLPYMFSRKFIDRAGVVLGWGCWLGAVLLSILPPDRGDGSGADTWRGRATFALVFAPLGCLARFYASLFLNGRMVAFPLGTFTVNVVGTAVLGMAWDLAHVPLGGVVGCQVLQGVEDGFCGCLTTVSTWVAELAALRRQHAYVYGIASVITALALLVAIMGGLGWSEGFAPLKCTH